MADAADGSNDWELVSLTASTYAAAPGPISPLLLQVDPAATSEQSQPSPATFMSQHFNLPAEESHADLLNGGRQELESTAVMLPLDGLGIPCAEKKSCCETETLGCNQPTGSSDSVIDKERKIQLSTDDVLVSRPGDGLLRSAAREDRQPTTAVLCSPPHAAAAGSDRTRRSASPPPPHSHVSAAAAAATDGIAVGSAAACLPAPGVAAPRVPCQAWWKKTFSFLRGNARESLTFRFVFVADKLQLRLEFGVDGQKISCTTSETPGQVKVSMLGGSPVAQQGKRVA